MLTLVNFILLIVGIVHLAPVIGALSGERLFSLYGVNVSDPNIELMMRHRAILFGLLGGLMLYSIFHPLYVTVILSIALFSTISFVILAVDVGMNELNSNVKKVFFIDIFCCAMVIFALLIHLVFNKT